MNIIFENRNLLVVNKPPLVSVFSEKKEDSLIDKLIEECPYLKEVGSSPRYGLIHRLDKETSGVLLIAKNKEGLIFFQKQFKKRVVKKKYIALVWGEVLEKEKEIRTLIGRSNKKGIKQKVYSFHSPLAKKSREAITKYKVIREYKDYTLLEVFPKTGRKHQIRVHLSYIGNPVVGDKKYSFKNQKEPLELNHHFLHAQSLKIKLKNNEVKEFKARLPLNLEKLLKKLN